MERRFRETHWLYHQCRSITKEAVGLSETSVPYDTTPLLKRLVLLYNWEHVFGRSFGCLQCNNPSNLFSWNFAVASFTITWKAFFDFTFFNFLTSTQLNSTELVPATIANSFSASQKISWILWNTYYRFHNRPPYTKLGWIQSITSHSISWWSSLILSAHLVLRLCVSHFHIVHPSHLQLNHLNNRLLGPQYK
jgi:hypothetical protein